MGASMGVSNVFAFVATCGNTTMGLDISFCASKGKSRSYLHLILQNAQLLATAQLTKLGHQE